MKQRIVGWVLIAIGLASLVITGFAGLITEGLPVAAALVLLIMSITPVVLGYFVLKGNRLAYWLSLAFFLVQLFGIETPQFSFVVSSPIDLSFAFSLTDKATGDIKATFIINFLAFIMCFLAVDLTREAKANENS